MKRAEKAARIVQTLEQLCSTLGACRRVAFPRCAVTANSAKISTNAMQRPAKRVPRWLLSSSVALM